MKIIANKENAESIVVCLDIFISNTSKHSPFPVDPYNIYLVLHLIGISMIKVSLDIFDRTRLENV